MHKARALLSALGVSVALALVAIGGCAKPDTGTSSGGCSGGQTACDQACVDLQTSAENCGSCGHSCGTSQTCSNGQCGCGGGTNLCGAACVNLTNTHDHCGSCDKACAVGEVCQGSQCTTMCSGGATNCNGGNCVDLNGDTGNCGSCGNRCATGRVCTAGVCACPAGQMVCGNGTCASSCGGGQGGTSGGQGGTSGGQGGTSGGQGGTSGGQGGSSGTAPPGWWTSGSWHGCSWTAKDTVTNSNTTTTPMDFLTTKSAPYCVSGTVNPTYESVAVLGFNLNETPDGTQTQCAYKPADPTKVGPPGVALMSASATGIAISFSRNSGSNLRIQIQGPNGGMTGTTGENDRWCYTITEVEGPVFAPFSKFNTHCWDMSGTAYAGQPISAVSFLVPGLLVPSPFNYCIGGFATGMNASAAPTYNPSPAPVVSGTIGGPNPNGVTGMDLDFQRVKVSPMGSTAQYIIQNNNWGTPLSTDQTITYKGNSFTIQSTTGNVTGQGVPASFPSIYVGGNGDTQSANDPPKGVFSTHPTDNLPKAINSLGSAMTTFTWTGGSGNKDFNATYDIWLASAAPSSAYSDAISGFVMVWLYQPSGRSPIGTKVTSSPVNIGGTMYDIWAGPRNSGSNPNRPVISYVVSGGGPVMSKTFDLKPILVDSTTNTAIPQAMRSGPSWLVTDIFGGFEVWTGSTASTLSMTNFTVAVQ